MLCGFVRTVAVFVDWSVQWWGCGMNSLPGRSFCLALVRGLMRPGSPMVLPLDVGIGCDWVTAVLPAALL